MTIKPTDGGRPALWAAPLLLVAAALAGCGDPTPKGAPDPVSSHVRSLPDYAGNATSFRDSFAEGATLPAEEQRKILAKSQVEPVAAPTIDGDNATVEVRIRQAGKELGTATWTLVKQGDK